MTKHEVEMETLRIVNTIVFTIFGVLIAVAIIGMFTQ